ncbi:MAG: PCP reductase family protein [Nitrospiraceae bacterium]
MRVGVDLPAVEADALVDRVMWTDDARHRLERVPPYATALIQEQAESYARIHGHRVITYDLFSQAKVGESIQWDVEAERRLSNVPPPVRTMARIELERTAVERGQGRVTVALMEEVKARYFGMAVQKS